MRALYPIAFLATVSSCSVIFGDHQPGNLPADDAGIADAPNPFEFTNYESETINAPDKYRGLGFGSSLALNDEGTKLVVGIPRAITVSDSGSIGGSPDGTELKSAGAFASYDKEESGWAFGFDSPGSKSNARFGASIDMSADGSKIAVGAPDSECAKGVDQQCGEVFLFDGAGDPLNQVITVFRPLAGWQHGASVALSPDGKNLLVGSPGGDRVHVFCLECTSEVPEEIEGAQSAFGSAMASARGDEEGSFLFVVGGPENNGMAERFHSTNIEQPVSWTGGPTGFGISVAVADGGESFIGSPMFGCGILRYDKSATGTEREGIPCEAGNSEFGRTIAVSADGNRLAAYARADNDNDVVHVYDISPEQEVTLLESFVGAEDSGFGDALSFSKNGRYLAIGETSGFGRVVVIDLRTP